MKKRPVEANWDLQAYQAALRPSLGQKVEAAVVATYSIDLPSLASALLALARQDCEDDSTQSIAFATAVTALRGVVKVLVQKRPIRATTAAKLTPLLDTFIKQVFIQKTASWHVKAFLLKLSSPTGVEWRFWLGSKNLTHDESWDAGLLLISDPDGRSVPGLMEAASELARTADLTAMSPSSVRAELKHMRWLMPAGVNVEEVSWLDADREYPQMPANASTVIVASPFLDKQTLKHFSQYGTERKLLSSAYELSRIRTAYPGTLNAFDGEIRAMAAPDLESTPIPVDDDEILPMDSLHAKLYYAQAGKTRMLWVGSANATQRGLLGPNVEIMARLSVNEQIAAGLEYFVRKHCVVTESQLPEFTPDSEEQQALDYVYETFLNTYTLTQTWTDRKLRIISSPPIELSGNIEVWIGPLTGDCVRWPCGGAELEFAAVESHQRCVFVQARFQSPDAITKQGLLCAPFVPPLDESRDAALIRANLSYSQRMELLLALLDGVPPREEPTEDGNDRGVGPGHGDGVSPEATFPTLEHLLKAWHPVDSRLREFDRHFREFVETIDDSSHGTAEARQNVEFVQMWDTVRAVLVQADDA